MTDPFEPVHADVERDGRADCYRHDTVPDPGPGERGYVPDPDEYREERKW